MIDHVWSVLCGKAVIDKDSNLMTLVETIEELTVEAGQVLESTPEGLKMRAAGQVPATALPVIPINVELVSLWVRRVPHEPTFGAARLVWGPPGQEPRSLGKTYDVDLSGEFKRLRTRVRISGLPAKETGRYTIGVELQQQGQESWEEVARIPLDIVLKFQVDEGERSA